MARATTRADGSRRKRRGPIPYEDFRAGVSFASVREELAEEQRRAYERGQYMFVTRRTVLGRMHQIKKEAYDRYLRARKRRRRRAKRAAEYRRAIERWALPWEGPDDGLPF